MIDSAAVKVMSAAALDGEAANEWFAQAIIDALPWQVAIIERTGRIIAVNRAWRRFARTHGGAAEQTAEGTNYLSVCAAATGADATPARRVAAAIVAMFAGERDSFELEYSCHVQGRQRWFSVRVAHTPANPPFAVITHQEITERKLAEQQQRLFVSLVENSNEFISMAGLRGRLQFINEAGRALVGLGKTADVTRMHIRDLRTQANWNDLHKHALTLALRDGHWEGDTQLRHLVTGEVIDVRQSLFVVHHHDTGEPSCFATVMHDIREGKRVAGELRAAKEAAEAASEAKTRFLANMSHEIRTPMTALLGFAELLDDPSLTQEQRQNCIHTIRRNGQHLLAIVGGILDVAKIEAGRIKPETIPCEVKQLVNEVAQLMRGRAEKKGLGLNVEIGGAVPRWVASDPTRLRQILMNLMGNAVKFTADGTITLRVRCQADGGHPTLVFEVIDTGIGISEVHQKKLFEPFMQADSSFTRRYGGTGLGLTISQTLARVLGGELTMRSELGVGSCFTLTLPMVVTDAGGPVRPGSDFGVEEAALGEQALAGGRVLLAEDGKDNQRLLQFLLEKAGAAVTIVDNGNGAINAALTAERQGEPFDVVLMDMEMPIVDGYQAAGVLREQGYERWIVALTAHAMASAREKCLAAGCDEYLAKPIDRERLIRAAARCLRPRPGMVEAKANAAEQAADG